MSTFSKIHKLIFSLFLAVVFVCTSSPVTFARGGGGHGGGGGYSSGGHNYGGGHSSSHSGGYSSHFHSSGHNGHTSSRSYLGVSRHSPSSKTHYSGGTYKSGYAKVERSDSAKHQFLREHGLTRIPPGMNIDHIRPLSQGGSDTPSNMQLLSAEAHHQKTAAERRHY